MIKKIYKKLFPFLIKKNKEDIKDVLEDLIDDKTNGSEEIDDRTKSIFKNVINLSDKCLEDVMIPRADVDAVPSDVVNVCVVPESVMLPTPAAIRSIISKFVLVDVPHVPDSSPVAIFLMPLFVV